MADLMAALMEAQAGMTGQFGDYYKKTQEATQKIQETSAASNELKTQVAAQELADTNNAVNVGKVLARALGADPNAANYRMETLAKTKAQSTDEALAATQQYEQLSQTSFLDNPLEWLINQFQKDSVAEQANAATERSMMATQEMADINQQIQQGVLTNKIVAETVNDDLTAKKLKLAGIANQQAAAELELKAIGANSDALKAVMQGNQSMMSAAQHQESVILQRQSMAQAQQHFEVNHALQVERFNLDKAQFEEAKKQHEIQNEFKAHAQELTDIKWDAKQDADANAYMLKLEDRMKAAEKAGKKDEAKALRDEMAAAKNKFAMDKAMAIQQGKADAVARFKTTVAGLGAEALINIPDNIYDAEKVINEGLQLAKNPKDAYGLAWKAVRDSTASVVAQQKAEPGKQPVIAFGFTPSEAINTVQVLQPKLDPLQVKTAREVDASIRQQIQAIKKEDPNISDKELKVEVDYRVAKHFTDMMISPESSDLTRVPKPAELLNFSPATKNSKFFKSYIAPKLETGNIDTSFDAISAMATKALLNKEMNLNEVATDLARLYSETITYNNAKHGFSRFGIPMMNSYTIHGIGERALDMTDPTDVKTAIIYNSLAHTAGGSLMRGAIPGAFNWLADKAVMSANPEEAGRR